jgi:hypothetical protein
LPERVPRIGNTVIDSLVAARPPPQHGAGRIGVTAYDLIMARPPQQRDGIQMGVMLSLQRHAPIHDDVVDGDVHAGAGLDGGHDGEGYDDEEDSLDRGYEFAPHRGHQYTRLYYESEEEEEY